MAGKKIDRRVRMPPYFGTDPGISLLRTGITSEYARWMVSGSYRGVDCFLGGRLCYTIDEKEARYIASELEKLGATTVEVTRVFPTKKTKAGDQDEFEW